MSRKKPQTGRARRSRDEYSPEAVDRMFGLVRWLHRTHLSTPMYMGAAVAMIPSYVVLVNLLNRTRVHHRERLPPRDHGFFLLSNHISMLDGQIISTYTFPRTYWFPSKAAFYKNTAMGLTYTALTAFKSFPVRRGERDVRAVELIEDLLDRGENVLLFPEGTRSRDGQLQPGKVGVGKIVHDSRPTVVPCYVEGFDRILRRGQSPRVGFGVEAHINFGAPLDLAELYDQPPGKETSQAIVDRVMEAIAALRDELHGMI